MDNECKNGYTTKDECDNKFMDNDSSIKVCSSCKYFVSKDGIYYCEKFQK